MEDPSNPYGGADPPPNFGTNFVPPRVVTNTPPRVSHIVRRNAAGHWMDDNNGDWTEWVSGSKAAMSGRIQGWDLPDRDLAVIDTGSFEVRYAQRLMNICMAVGVNPVSGEIAVAGTDAINERRFEPNLKGVFLRVSLALVNPVTLSSRISDLNSHLDYATRSLPPAQRALGLGDPRGIEWNSAGTRAYITGMGSRNLIIVDSSGARINAEPIELPEGPTGMALDEARGRLYVWNRFASSISVVDTESGTVVTNVPVFDPTPEVVRKGRRHLYDTRDHSGLGIVSCASCHVDARMDRLAWDLGDPGGTMVTNSIGTPIGLAQKTFLFHPMKGPMVTQTLQDIITPTNAVGPGGQPFVEGVLHWRGDRTNLEAFNATFPNLLARETQLTTNEMAEFKGMLRSISFPPNYLRTLSNTLPASVSLAGFVGRTNSNGLRLQLPPGQPARVTFSSCARCHDPNTGLASTRTNQLQDLPRAGTEHAFKATQLRNLLERGGMDYSSTNSRAGFGFMHDGRVDTLSQFMIDGFPSEAPSDQEVADFVALMLCFNGSDLNFLTPLVGRPSQDVPASAGKQITFAPTAQPALLNAMLDLANRTNSRVELIIRGKKNGLMRQWLYRRGTGDFQADRHGEIAGTLGDVLAGGSSQFTASLVPENTGRRLALDRDEDGYYDTSEVETGFDPADASSHPGQILNVTKAGGNVLLSWRSAMGAKYAVEWRTNWPAGFAPWLAASPGSTSALPITVWTDSPPSGEMQRFYRVRMEP
jgi:YVTN family beta-propeller protein